MGFSTWMNSKVQKLDWLDIGMIKWSVLFFTLMLAKFCPVLLSWEWYCYLGVALVLSIRPVYRAYIKKQTKRPVRRFVLC